MTTKESLKAIIPGKTYPAEVTITEPGSNGQPTVVKFCMNSFFVGMYCCVYIDGQVAMQRADHNNKSLVSLVKKNIVKAIERGATVEIDSIREIKTSI